MWPDLHVRRGKATCLCAQAVTGKTQREATRLGGIPPPIPLLPNESLNMYVTHAVVIHVDIISCKYHNKNISHLCHVLIPFRF